MILEHSPGTKGPAALHWDLMLESAARLRTWALDAPLTNALSAPIAAMALPDHRLAYLDYEGPLSGERGSVVQVTSGTYETLEERPGLLRIKLLGAARSESNELALQGTAALSAEPRDPQRWRLDWSAD